MINLKHLITIACLLVGATFAFGQTLSITPDMGTYTPNSTQNFTFTLANITNINCQGVWTISAESSSNYGGFISENMSGTIDLTGGLQMGSVDLTFATPPSGDLIISNITATPPGGVGCTYSVLTDEAVTLTATETPSGETCDAAFLENFQGVAENTGFDENTSLNTNPVVVGQGTAYWGAAAFPQNSFFKVVDNDGGAPIVNRMAASGVDNEVRWESQDIVISPCCSKTISVDIFGQGNQPTDYVRVYYQIDEGTPTLIGEGLEDFETTVSITTCEIAPITEISNLKIIIRILNNNTSELHGFDNVQVTAGTPVEAPQVLNISCSGDMTSSTVTVNAVAECTAEYSFDGGAYTTDNFMTMVAVPNMMYPVSVRDATFPDCGITSSFVTIDATGNCNFILPVTLLDFYGRAEADAIGLYWSTSTELNNDYMAVERSLNGIDFEKIGQVDGRGTTTEQQNYTFVDNYPAPGTNYYRLRQVDYDGGEELHPVISVLFDRPLEFGVKISPNPARETLQIDWSLPQKQDGMLRVFDLQGQLMSQRAIAQGSGRYNLPISDLPAGLYVLQMEQGGKTETLRFVKQ